MLLKKIPKRTVLLNQSEFKDIWKLVISRSIKDGDLIREFEDKFKTFIGVKEAIAVSSGRFALYLILKNIGMKKGDGIILSAYNFKGVPNSLLENGFAPVFVDADEKSYQIDASKIEQKINGNVKAIMLTHLFGQPGDLDKILDISRKYNLFLIEDAAHSLGSYYAGKHTGGFGEAGFFSFSGSKLLNTSFGGMVVTDNKELANNIRQELNGYDFPASAQLLRERIITYIYVLLTKRFVYSFTEYPVTLLMSLCKQDPLEIYKSLKKREITDEKMKFTNLQAMLGIKQMVNMESLISKRRKIAEELYKRLDSSISLQLFADKCLPNYFMIPLKTKDKFKAFRKLLFAGIDTNLAYANDCSFMSNGGTSKTAKFLSDSILTLNLPFDLNEKEINHLALSINSVKELLY